MIIVSQYHYEKTWTPTPDKEILRMLTELFPDIPPQETLPYIKSECALGKIVTFNDVKFKAQD